MSEIGKEELGRLDSIKKCPLCGEKLEKGYVISSGFIRWDTKKHKFLAAAGELLCPTFSLTLPNLPSLRCKQCSIVIFDYEKYR